MPIVRMVIFASKREFNLQQRENSTRTQTCVVSLLKCVKPQGKQLY